MKGIDPFSAWIAVGTAVCYAWIMALRVTDPIVIHKPKD